MCKYDRRLAGVVAQDLAQIWWMRSSFERRRRQLAGAARRGAVVEALDDVDVLGHEADTRVSSRLSMRPLTVTIGSSTSLWPCSISVPREHRDLDRAVEVLEDEDRHLVALLGELAGQVGDHPAECNMRAVVALERLGDRRSRPCGAAPPRRRAADGRLT